jgi:LacI family transcriptional regulator
MSSDELKHRRIADGLREAIADGRFPVGARLPSESRLVRQHGVSRPTANRALGELVAAGLIERRVGSGSYVLRATALETPQRRFGLLLPGFRRTEIFERIRGELAAAARSHGAELLWGGPDPAKDPDDLDIASARKACDAFVAARVDGVFFAPFELIPDREEANGRIAGELRAAGIPVVLLDRDLGPFPKRSDFDLVGIDNMAAGYRLGEHVLKLGCERVAFVARPHSAPTVDARIHGVRAALANHHVEPDPRWVHLGDPNDVRFVRRLMAGRRWDVLLCANDHTAFELMATLGREGFEVPADVRMTGFDDVHYSSRCATPLTTIQQPCRNIALVALRAMLDRLADPSLPARCQLLAPSLELRDSCGAYRTPARRKTSTAARLTPGS